LAVAAQQDRTKPHPSARAAFQHRARR